MIEVTGEGLDFLGVENGPDNVITELTIGTKIRMNDGK